MTSQPTQGSTIDNSTSTAKYDVFWVEESRVALDDFSMNPNHAENRYGLTLEEAEAYMKKLAESHCHGTEWRMDDLFKRDLWITINDHGGDTIGQVRGVAK